MQSCDKNMFQSTSYSQRKEIKNKGPGLVRGILASDFLKKYNSLFCLACTLIIKAILHKYKIHPQIFVLMYSVAMERQQS